VLDSFNHAHHEYLEPVPVGVILDQWGTG
jgi:hypothetical protein